MVDDFVAMRSASGRSAHDEKSRREAMMKAMEDMAKLAATPTMIVGDMVPSVHDLSKRVKELEGYMPILLDKLEEQHEQIKKLNASMLRIKPHAIKQ